MLLGIHSTMNPSRAPTTNGVRALPYFVMIYAILLIFFLVLLLLGPKAILRVLAALVTLAIIGGIAFAILSIVINHADKVAAAAASPTPTPLREEDEEWQPLQTPAEEVEWDKLVRQYYENNGYRVRPVPSPTPYDPASLPLVRTKGEFRPLPKGALYRCAFDGKIHRRPIDYAPSWDQK
jgi:hypothetical protein